MSTHLVACPRCSRHVRVVERACPFCKAALGQSLRDAPAPMRPPLGLSRAALYAVGASALAIVAGCEPEPMVVTLYGAAVPIPSGCEFPGGLTVGEPCTGDVYVAPLASSCGYLVCYDDVWTFTDDLPSGYVLRQEAGTPFHAGRDGSAETLADGSLDH